MKFHKPATKHYQTTIMNERCRNTKALMMLGTLMIITPFLPLLVSGEQKLDKQIPTIGIDLGTTYSW